MKRRIFYGVLSVGCAAALIPGTNLMGSDLPMPAMLDPQYQEHLDWAKHKLAATQPTEGDYSRQIGDYLQPHTPVHCKNSKDGMTLNYSNKYGISVEIQVLNGRRKLIFRSNKTLSKRHLV